MLSVCGFLSGTLRVQDLLILLPRDGLAGQRSPQHPVVPQSSQIVGLYGLVIRHCHIINLHSSDEIRYRNYSYVARTCKVRCARGGFHPPIKKRAQLMDSLAVSAIGLAAGGWQNVKLVTSFYKIADGSSKNVPTWKMGICQIPASTIHSSGAYGSSFTPMTSVLVVPSTHVVISTNGEEHVSVIFNTTSISVARGAIVAILFTWT